MCGRYYIQDDMLEGIGRMVEKVKLDSEEKVKAGEIFPTNEVPIIVAEGDDLVLTSYIWGYPGLKKGQTIINARSETVREKRTFKAGVESRRAIIPMSYYFEWNKEKEKIEFHPNQGDYLFAAGIYDEFDGETRFVMLTRDAVEGMEDVHHRMPLLFEQEQIESWIWDEGKLGNLLDYSHEALRREFDRQQMSMDSLLKN